LNRPSLTAVLRNHGISPQKSLGQNFLLDENITRKIVAFADSLEGFTVIEIGPGPGGLTRAILDAGAKEVYAIEYDLICAEALKELDDPRLNIIHQDALTVDFGSLISTNPGKIKIIANLPYNIASSLLTSWFPYFNQISSLTLMFQKEVVDRLVAKPNTSNYGRLSVVTQILSQSVQNVMILPPHVFTPAPKVDSAVVQIIPNPTSLDLPLNFLENFVKKAFQNRRKMLRATFKDTNEKECFSTIGIELTRRSETISVQDFYALSKLLLLTTSPTSKK
jgi:16S rRNA (adenine1518-N6/adenine1519-N6)-dimethyltransferase